MKTAFSSQAIRRAEAPMLASLPTDALMRRAAGQLASRVADRCTKIHGGVYGARVTLLVGPGNNGGDALFAGASLVRSGAKVDAVMVTSSAHTTGLAAFERAGGNLVWAVQSPAHRVKRQVKRSRPAAALSKAGHKPDLTPPGSHAASSAPIAGPGFLATNEEAPVVRGVDHHSEAPADAAGQGRAPSDTTPPDAHHGESRAQPTAFAAALAGEALVGDAAVGDTMAADQQLSGESEGSKSHQTPTVKRRSLREGSVPAARKADDPFVEESRIAGAPAAEEDILPAPKTPTFDEPTPLADETLSAFAATMAVIHADELRADHDDDHPVSSDKESGAHAHRDAADDLDQPAAQQGDEIVPTAEGTTPGARPTRHPTSHARPTAGSADLLDFEQAEAVLREAQIVVDGVFGLGGRAGIHGVASRLASKIPAHAHVIAVDLPSGLDSDSGTLPHGEVLRADETVTFGALKPCHVLPPAKYLCGDIHVADIGLDLRGEVPAVVTLGAADVAKSWPAARRNDHKYTRGVLGIVAGGDKFTGAAVLSVQGALGAGVGMVRYVGSPASSAYVRSSCPEATMGSGQVQAWTLGPGVDPADADQRYAVSRAMSGTVPCVLDAGALVMLSTLSEHRRPRCPLVLTPHAGELALLMETTRDEVDADPLTWASRAAREFNATVVLKGATTLIVDAEGAVFAQPDGPAWLATAGSGDVLAGIIGTLLAAGIVPSQAAAMGVFVHSHAGLWASGGGPLRASDLPAATSAVLAELLTTQSL